MSLAPGTNLGRYQILGPLGAGGKTNVRGEVAARRRPRSYGMAVSAAVLLLAAACGGGVSVTDEDAGKTIDLPVGQTLNVTLQGLGAAGYVWDVVSPPGPVLEQAGGRETLPLESNAAGSSAREAFHFKAASPGEVKLQLALSRPFGAHEVAKTFELTVRVR